jgi:hypothetical protein
MPTGYTHKVQDGKITSLRDFAMECVRGMGVCISMRDDPHDKPIPERFEPEASYHDEHIATARNVLDKTPGLTPQECDVLAQADFEAEMESHIKYANNRQQAKANYQNMIAKVEAWKPHEDVVGLKDFMLQQLRESIKFDCSDSYRPEPPIRLTGEQWRQKQLERASRDLAYHEKKRAAEIRRVEDRNRYLVALRESLQ